VHKPKYSDTLVHNSKEVPKSKLRNQYNARAKKGKNGFKSFEEYVQWYTEQPKRCSYCMVDEETVREIVLQGKLKSARFPIGSKITRGRSRGVNLEVDRWDSSKPYSKKNCCLACYFCNNDKSDVFDGKEYVKFFENRKEYLERKLKSKRK
jgi:hypothetical protein